MKNKKANFKTAVIGAGSIGAFSDRPGNSRYVQSHAHAYQLNPSTELVAFCDIDLAKSRKAAKQWGGRAYSDLDEMLSKESLDIISVCSPDESHYEIVKQCLTQAPSLKAIFCEKPFVMKYDEAGKLFDLARQKGILLAVNFTRRWEPEIVKLKKEIQNGKFGRLINGACIYNKGILHNGCHAIDLLLYWFGGIKDVTALASRQDYKSEDPTIDAFLTLDNGGMIHLVGADQSKYSIFDLGFYFERGKIVLHQAEASVSIYEAVPHPKNPVRKRLQQKQIKKGLFQQSIRYAVENLVQAIEKKAKLDIQPEEVLVNQSVCQKLLDGVKRLQGSAKVIYA